jgi:hypothetical protein
MSTEFGFLALWCLIATVAMTAILQASVGLGYSRMSLPFLVGAFFTDDRRRAVIWGFVLYVMGGWLFGLLYYALFESVHLATWWFGAAAGFLHGLLLVAFALPLLPFIHPRMASEYHGATMRRQLEPPGFFGLNYGWGTPAVTILAQTAYGATLGGLIQLHRML